MEDRVQERKVGAGGYLGEEVAGGKGFFTDDSQIAEAFEFLCTGQPPRK